MQDYTLIWLNLMGIHPCDVADAVCQVCGKQCADVHHIDGRIGKLRTDPYNLIGLCRSCHQQAHHINGSIDKKILREIVKNRLER